MSNKYGQFSSISTRQKTSSLKKKGGFQHEVGTLVQSHQSETLALLLSHNHPSQTERLFQTVGILFNEALQLLTD